jgi:plastocyanin
VASPVAALTVKMTSQLHFEPEEVTIQRGETITWINTSPIPHTTTGDPAKNPVKKTRPELAQLPPRAKGWDSGLLNEGQSFSHTFTVVGEYAYFCIPHLLSGMLGRITVQE